MFHILCYHFSCVCVCASLLTWFCWWEDLSRLCVNVASENLFVQSKWHKHSESHQAALCAHVCSYGSIQNHASCFKWTFVFSEASVITVHLRNMSLNYMRSSLETVFLLRTEYCKLSWRCCRTFKVFFKMGIFLHTEFTICAHITIVFEVLLTQLFFFIAWIELLYITKVL